MLFRLMLIRDAFREPRDEVDFNEVNGSLHILAVDETSVTRGVNSTSFAVKIGSILGDEENAYAEIERCDRRCASPSLPFERDSRQRRERCGEDATCVISGSRERAHIWHVSDVYHRRMRSHRAIGHARGKGCASLRLRSTIRGEKRKKRREREREASREGRVFRRRSASPQK